MYVLDFATVIVVLIVSSTAATAAERPMPAVWTAHTLIVDLGNLPKRYSCDDLWYKFKAVLLTLGARSDLKIFPFRCERSVGSTAYSPKVQLEFSTPRAVSANDAQWADMQAVSKSIRLQPGSPDRLDAKDCELLEQIKSTLLPYLEDPVTGFNLACQASQTAEPSFGLTVTALIPVAKSAPAVASILPANHVSHSRTGP